MSTRNRGQRITRPELIRDSRAALIQAGVGNHARAQFVFEISKVVIGSDPHVYAQLQPHIRKHETEAWQRAYFIVYQYLTDHKFDITLKTTRFERQADLPSEPQDDLSADEQLGGLLESAPGKMPVKERIAKAKREKPMPRPKAKAVTVSTLSPASEPASVKPTGKKITSLMKGDSEEELKRTPSTVGRKTTGKTVQKRTIGKPSDKSGPTPKKDSKVLLIQSPTTIKRDVAENSEPSDFVVEDVKPRRSKR
jgi:hypothetical protein